MNHETFRLLLPEPPSCFLHSILASRMYNYILECTPFFGFQNDQSEKKKKPFQKRCRTQQYWGEGSKSPNFIAQLNSLRFNIRPTTFSKKNTKTAHHYTASFTNPLNQTEFFYFFFFTIFYTKKKEKKVKKKTSSFHFPFHFPSKIKNSFFFFPEIKISSFSLFHSIYPFLSIADNRQFPPFQSKPLSLLRYSIISSSSSSSSSPSLSLSLSNTWIALLYFNARKRFPFFFCHILVPF